MAAPEGSSRSLAARALDVRLGLAHARNVSTPAPQGYYAATAGTPARHPRLAGRVRADICVVGGGYTGLSAALHLARAGADVLLLEAEQIAFAASGRNGGQIHSGHRKSQRELETWLGRDHARALWRIAEDGKALVRALIGDHSIDCDLRDGLVIAAHDRRALADLSGETAHLSAQYAYSSVSMLDRAETAAKLGTDIYPGGQFDAGGGHLHPLKFAYGIAVAAARAGARICEQSRVVAVEQDRNEVLVRAETGDVRAQRAILACDAMTASVAPSLAPYLGHVESFLVATEPLPPQQQASILPADAAVADTRHVLDYYRKSADGRLLFAGRESYWSVPNDVAKLVRPRMLRVFPELANSAIDFAWSGTVGITRTRMPHFGRLGDRVLFGYGYSGHGVALATIGGKLLAEAALGNSERFAVLASVPARPFPGGARLRKPLITAGLVWYKLLDGL